MATEKEKTGIATEKGEEIHSVQNGDAEAIFDKFDENDFEVFKRGEDVVDFRNVEWYKASVIFLKGKKLIIVWDSTLLKSESHLRNRCLEYSHCHALVGSCWRCAVDYRLGSSEHLHRHCSG